MANAQLLSQIRPGMEARSADDVWLGTVRMVWYGDDPIQSSIWCDEAACSRVEIDGGSVTLYIPYSMIADVTGMVVALTLDAAAVNAKGWSRKPAWIPDRSSLIDDIPRGQVFPINGW